MDLSTTTTVDGTGTSDLVTVTPSSVEVPAGGSAQVLLQVGPVRRHAAGWYEGRMTGVYAGGNLTVPYLAQVEQAASVDITPSSIARTLGLFQRGNDTLTIGNLGAGNMSFDVEVRDAETVSGVSHGSPVQWVCVDPTDGQLGAGESVDVTVSTNCLRDLGLGVYAAEIAINSNDPVRPSVIVPVTVSVEVGPPPDIEVTPGSLDVSVSVDERLSAFVEVANLDTGDAGGVLRYVLSDLEPTFVEDAAWLSQEPGSGLIDPGTSDRVAVVFDASGLSTGSYRSLMLIASNDPDDPHTLLPVSMTVIAPDIDVTPTAFDFTLDRDQTATGDLEIENSGPGTLFFEVLPLVPWLSVHQGQVAPGGSQRVVITVVSSAQDPGVHTGDILVHSNDPDESPVAVQVLLTVLAPDISVAPASIDLGTLDRDRCASRDLTVANSGDGTLVFDVSSDDLDLQAGAEQQHRLPPATGSASVRLSICTTEVDPGEHRFDVIISSNDPDEPEVRVPVDIDVPAPAIEVSPVSLLATLDRDGAVLQSVGLVNGGSGTLAYRVEPTVPWLVLSQVDTEGDLAPGGTGDVPVLIDATDADPGIHTGALVIHTNDPLQTTITVPVTMTVLAPEMDVSPSSFALTLAGRQSTTLDLTISNSGQGTLVVEPEVRPLCPSSGAWLSLSTSYLEVKTGDSKVLTLTIDTTFLGPGACTGLVVIGSNDPQRPQVMVSLTVVVDWALVSGRVMLEEQSDHSGTSLVFSRGSTTIDTAKTDEDGAFLVALEPGSYHVTARHRYHLPWHADIELSPLETRDVGARLIAGDWNGDGVIDIRDIIIAVKNLTRTTSP